MFITELFTDTLSETQCRRVYESADPELRELINLTITEPLSDATETIIHQAAQKLQRWAQLKLRTGGNGVSNDTLMKIAENPKNITRQLVQSAIVNKWSSDQSNNTAFPI